MYTYMYAHMYTHIIRQSSSISQLFFVTHTIQQTAAIYRLSNSPSHSPSVPSFLSHPMSQTPTLLSATVPLIDLVLLFSFFLHPPECVHLLGTCFRAVLLLLSLRAGLFCVAVAVFADLGFISVVGASRAVIVAVRLRPL